MRGGFLHNQILIAPIETHFFKLGAQVHREYPVTIGSNMSFVDLFVVYNSSRIVCEAELTADRVLNDLDKAAALQASILLIVTPNWLVARAAERRVNRAGNRTCAGSLDLFILPIGHAMQWLRNKFPIMSCLNVLRTLNH